MAFGAGCWVRANIFWLVIAFGFVNGLQWRASIVKAFSRRITSQADGHTVLDPAQEFAFPGYYSRFSPYFYTTRPIQLISADGICNYSDEVLSRRGGLSITKGSLFVLLVQTGGCSILDKIRFARVLSAAAILMYDPSGSPSSAMSENPLRVDSGAGRTQDMILTIGISQSAGVRAYSLLQSGHDIKVTISPSRTGSAYKSVDTSSKLLLYTCIIFSTLAGMTLIGASALYGYWYWKAKQGLRGEMTRQEEARRIIRRLPTRTYREQDLPESESDYITCVVCIDDLDIGDVVRKLPCKHEFHKDCIDRWLIDKQTCPLCKYNILTGVIDEAPEEHETVQLTVVETAGGTVPPASALTQAAALPLPPSRLSAAGWEDAYAELEEAATLPLPTSRNSFRGRSSSRQQVRRAFSGPSFGTTEYSSDNSLSAADRELLSYSPLIGSRPGSSFDNDSSTTELLQSSCSSSPYSWRVQYITGFQSQRARGPGNLRRAMSALGGMLRSRLPSASEDEDRPLTDDRRDFVV